VATNSAAFNNLAPCKGLTLSSDGSCVTILPLRSSAASLQREHFADDYNLFMGQAALRDALTRQCNGTMQLGLQRLHVGDMRQVFRYTDVGRSQL